MLWQNPVVIAFVVGLPSLLIGFFGYRHSNRVDALAEQAGMETARAGTISQVIDGLNQLIARLQDDNAVLRKNIDALNDKLTKIIGHCEDLKQELADLKRRLPPNNHQGASA